MSRMLEMSVYGGIAGAQLALAMFLLGLYIHGPARAAPSQAINNAPQRHLRDSITAPASFVSLAIPHGNAQRS